ncbi:MAG: beta-ketoacyl synthase N-terminal-like domain-containing protein, partial [Betaproteobacteria bacterium]
MSERAVAIVGLGAVLPDAPNAPAFRDNVWSKKYSITEVPPDRWSVADYYDPDPAAPARTYSKIGAWVRGFEFDWKRWHVPPRVAGAMDEGQQWAITIAAEALADYGYPGKKLDVERTAVVLGNAMAGERHYLTTLRISFPEYRRLLNETKEFLDLPAPVREAILSRWYEVVRKGMPDITEDTMPGELSNILSGRVANVLNLRGPNFTTDAACASTFAALDAAVDMLVAGHCDAVLTGGVDRNMGTNSFVKFSKIGALSATGTRPFGDGADGFVMGEGSAAFLLKRLADAERDGDRVYAVVRGIGGSSDGKGKGITAPNPIGQQLAIARAWQNAGLEPATAGLIEAHGTSTKVGDVVEVESLVTVFAGAARGSIALGSAKSNVGHLKAGAGAAGLLKAVWAVHEKCLPPTLHADPPNPDIDFASTPFVLNHELREWKRADGTPRRCGVSAYGFGGTNFHVVLEEHVPGALTRGSRPAQVAVAEPGGAAAPSSPAAATGSGSAARPPLRGLVVLGAQSVDGLRKAVNGLVQRVKDGHLPPVAPPLPADLAAPERVAIDFEDGKELLERLQKAQKALVGDAPATWRAFHAQGVFRGSGRAAGKIAFLFTGQGSQYVNMGRDLAAADPVVAAVFEEADRVLEPILGRKLTSYIFVDRQDPEAVRQAEEDLKQTAITQPAVLSMDTAMCRLLAEYGIEPDMVMGHSLGEYGALVSAEVLTFAEALEAAAARGREMSRVSFGDNGAMAAVMAPIDLVSEVLKGIDGYVVPANLNARGQVVIGGETAAVLAAVAAFDKRGYPAQRLQVSHAFHTRIVAAAAAPLRKVLERFDVRPPKRLLVGNVEADFYPSDPEAIRDVLCRQIASPVRWVEGVERLYGAGARAFVEVGPKRALKGFVDDVLADKADVTSLFTNRPRPKELASFNQALAGLYAAGYGTHADATVAVSTAPVVRREAPAPQPTGFAAGTPAPTPGPVDGGLDELRALLTKTLESLPRPSAVRADGPYDRNDVPQGSIVISGTGLGLPGANKAVMDSKNAARILAGEQLVGPIPMEARRGMARRRLTRLVKTADGSGHFELIEDEKDVIKLAGRPGSFDLTAEYGVDPKLVEALDATTQLAIAAGLDALREAGIPLVQTYKKTTTGKYLPERWMLPESLRDETGVVFASAFPGYNRFADEAKRYYTFESRRAQKRQLEELLEVSRDATTRSEISRRVSELDVLLEKEPYTFDRRFLLRVLTMGHSQFAEYIGARGPNTHVNAACASTASAVALAEDWIRSGRCRRVVVVGADNVTSDAMIEWIGAGFVASGAGATDERVEDAALPFDRRRHGTLLGMGACALVVESQDAVEERGMRGIVELMSTEARNSAFHATRLDVGHVASVVESLVASAERRFGIDRRAIAPCTVFVSHETYTPARGGSAAAEITALRQVFGPAADQVIVANTKGFTGHPMGVGIEDVIGVKILEHQIVPPVPNLKEPDPDLGALTLSKGGRYPVEYAIHLAAGFGSQIALTFSRRIPGPHDRVDDRPRHERWLAEASGYAQAWTEVVNRVLRIAAQGAPGVSPAASSWRFGLGPVRRTPFPGDVVRPAAASAASMATPPPLAPGVPAGRPEGAPAAFLAAAAGPGVARPEIRPEVASQAGEGSVARPGAVEPVVERVLAIVSDKTGYPPDMLDLELDLEADLGVDTVKQAETFAAVREEYGIERQESLKLRDFPTLQSVVGFVYRFRPDLVPAAVAGGVHTPLAPRHEPGSVARSADPARHHLRTAAAPSPADAVAGKVLAIVAEKTGYPQDMLEMDLDLEADLGVDTVKQAETFAAVREAYGIERQESLKLRDFPTLRHVVEFVYRFRPDLKPQAAGPASSVSVAPSSGGAASSGAVGTGVERARPPETASTESEPVVQKVLAIVAEKTGYPEDMLELDLDLEADLGVDTVKQAETFAAVREAYGIERQESLKLRDFPTLRSVVGFVYRFRPDLQPASRQADRGAATLPAERPAEPGVSPSAQGPDASRQGAAAATAVPLKARLEDADKMPRRVPVPSLRPPLELCKPTGVSLAKGARVVVASDEGGVSKALTDALVREGVSVLALDGASATADVTARIAGWLAQGPIAGV